MKFCQSFNMRYFQLHVDLYGASIDISRFLFHNFQGNSVPFFSLFKVGADSPISILQRWKTFCTCYFNNWCRTNVMCGLLIDSATQAVGVIRKNSVSMCRSLEDIELLVSGMSDNFFFEISFSYLICLTLVRSLQIFLIQLLVNLCSQDLLMNMEM